MKKRYFLLLLVILVGAVLRFYRLKDFPVQLNHDEVSQLYDAISIAQTQKDIYGNFLPTIFVSIGDFKSPFYTYITSLFYFIFGGGELTIRLPGAFFGLLIIPAIYFFVSKLLKNWKIGIIAAFLTAFSPFEIFFSRKSFENVAGILLMLIGFACLFSFMEKRTRKWLYLGIVILGLALYTYFSHAIIIPLLLISFIIIFKNYFFPDFKKFLPVLTIFILLFLPILFLILTNADARNRSQAVFVTQDMNLGRQIDYGNKYQAIFDFSFNRYLKQFSPDFIFGDGLDFTNQGPLGMGLLPFILLPFFVLGIIYLSKLSNFSKQKQFILIWILLGILPSGLTFEQHSPHRSIMVFTMLNIISAVGLYAFTRFLNDLKRKKSSIFTAYVILITFFLINFVFFIHMYFVNFPFEKSQYIHYPFKQVAQFAWSHHEDFNQIIFDPLFGESAPVVGTAAHYYIAYYGNYPPAKFQQEYRKGDKEREVLFDKFSIRKLDWRVDQNLKNVLIIASSWSLPIDTIDKSNILKTFYFYDGKPAFYAIKL